MKQLELFLGSFWLVQRTYGILFLVANPQQREEPSVVFLGLSNLKQLFIYSLYSGIRVFVSIRGSCGVCVCVCVWLWCIIILQ